MKRYVFKGDIEDTINSIISGINISNIESEGDLEQRIQYAIRDGIVQDLVEDVVKHITNSKILVDFDVIAVDGSGKKIKLELKGIVLDTSCLFNNYKFGDDAWDAIMKRLQRIYPNDDFTSKDAYLDEYIDKNIRLR